MWDQPFLIAEIGNNHNGSVKLCMTLIERAAASGAHAVKLQKRSPCDLYTRHFYDRPYNGPHSFGPTYGLHREALEFDKYQWTDIVQYANHVGITLFSTAFDMPSVEFLAQFDLPFYKVASGCLRDTLLIKALMSLNKPLVISCGGSEWEDVDRVYEMLVDTSLPFALLHCTMQYPCEPANVNLSIIKAMCSRYPKATIGFSDHTIGTWAIPAAFTYGALVMEKHFTSNKSLPGPDHALSVEPHELQAMAHTLDRLNAAVGSDDKHLLPCEHDGYYKMGKGIYSVCAIRKGQVIRPSDICIKSPADGLPPCSLNTVVGARAFWDIPEGYPVSNEDLGGE